MKCISLFKCTPQIEVIDKSHCSLEDVPNFQNYSRSLEELFLDANKLTVLNDNVFRLTKLRRFSFSDNAIQDIPPDIAKLVNLVELDCSRNKIQVIPEQIKFLRGLQVCDFSANNIEYLPPGLVQLKNLTCLTLNYCPIKNLPDDFGLLKNLESLELRENELESLPASMSSLESLKKLDVGRNLISHLPEDIGRLTKLEYLLVDGNRLETIPTKIGRLQNLQCLDLSQQEYGLKYLPEEISDLVSLTDFHLSENHLQSLPDGIRNLKKLTIFKVDNNYLSELNPNIGGCISMQELVLTSNQITKLPSSIGNLTDLRSLNVDSNLLRELTPQIGNLRCLGILSMRDNLLTHLPNEIGQLELAKVMDFSGNRLEYLPVSITALNLKALWLSKNQAQPLPRLQIDELANSTRVLTCYLLPQQSEENDDSDQANAFQNQGFENYDQNRTAAVSFDTPAVDDVELSDDANFVRHDTPHPRELKARHQKLFTQVEKPELKGHDNASFSLVDVPQKAYAHDEQDPAITFQHLEYESNGLPEVPMTKRQPDTKNYIGYVTPISRDNGDFRKEVEYSMGYNSNGLYHNQEARKSYDQDASNNNKQFNKDSPQLESTNRSRHELSIPDGCKIMDILVRRSKNYKPGLGLSIAGGKDTPPFKDNDEGIFVSKVTKGGPAEAAGVLVGDKILGVNDAIFKDGIGHQEAVNIFEKVRDYPEFSLKVLRDSDFSESEYLQYRDQEPTRPQTATLDRSKIVETNRTTTNTSSFTRTYTIPIKSETNGSNTTANLRQYLLTEQPAQENKKPTSATLPAGMSLVNNSNSVNKNIIYTTLVKDYKHDLGLVLENRSDDGDSRASWSNIVISQIKPNSIADMDGKLQIDDRMLSINGTDVTGVDLERVMLMLEGTERFIRIVVSRGDDPIGAALKNMPVRPSLGSWFSSTSNMSHRPSLIESYQRPTFGSVSSLQKQHSLLGGSKPPKPPKPSHLVAKDHDDEQSQFDDDPIARPRGFKVLSTGNDSGMPQTIDAEKRAAWRRERLKSIEDDVEIAKLIAEAQRRKREEQ